MDVPYRDREKQREAQRLSNQRRRKKVSATRKAQRHYLRGYIRDLKRRPCADCKVEYPPIVMDFHHVNGIKLSAVGTMANHCRPIEVIDAEIAKCVLLCANCHRLRHEDDEDYGDSSNGKTRGFGPRYQGSNP